MSGQSKTFEGGCSCGQVRYKALSAPMIVHCCHCSWCQRQTGSAFAVNALIEADRVQLLQGQIEEHVLASPSGKGQTIARCSNCSIAVWSNYNMSGLRERIRFIRVGTLDEPDSMSPDVHIYTMDKQSWVQIPDGDQRAEAFYKYEETWSRNSLARRASLFDAANIAMP